MPTYTRQEVLKNRGAWLEALRSGKYQQTKQALCAVQGERKGYCCLGVLCDLVDPEGWDNESPIRGHQNGHATLPSEAVRNAIGLTAHGAVHLAQLNDMAGLTFKQIAEVVELEWASPSSFPNFWELPKRQPSTGITTLL